MSFGGDKTKASEKGSALRAENVRNPLSLPKKYSRELDAMKEARWKALEENKPELQKLFRQSC